jgi:hypothetical protein
MYQQLHRTMATEDPDSSSDTAQTMDSISSCQYPRHEVRNMKPVAQIKCPKRNIQSQIARVGR